jgi:hypothetical protein
MLEMKEKSESNKFLLRLPLYTHPRISMSTALELGKNYEMYLAYNSAGEVKLVTFLTDLRFEILSDTDDSKMVADIFSLFIQVLGLCTKLYYDHLSHF